MPDATSRFKDQKRHSRDRGIPFYFTLEMWIAWWKENLGDDWFTMRGCKRNQYVMARKNDKGAYEPNNVECILSVDNHRAKKLNGGTTFGERHGRSRLTETQVAAIRKSRRDTKELAMIYGMSVITIRDIRARRRWKHLP